MTGLGLKQRYSQRWDDAGSPYLNSTQLNRLFESAILKIIQSEYNAYQATQNVTDNLNQLVTKATIVPTANVININPTGGQITNYFHLTDLQVAFVSTPAITDYKQASLRRSNESGNVFDSGKRSIRYPKYTMTSLAINIIAPATATSALVEYIKTPVYPDVDNNTTLLPYSDKLIDLIIDEAIGQISVSTREYNELKVAEQEVATNR